MCNRNQKRIFKFVSIIIILSVVIGMAGCNTAFEKDSNVVYYASMWKEGEPQATWLKNTIGAFEKKTGIKVKLKLEGREVLTKEKGNIIMNTPPDIIDQDMNELSAALLDKEILALPLDDLYNSRGPEGQEKLENIFSKKLVDMYKKGGKSYFLPYEFITTLFVCDENMMNKYGLSIPRTWQDFINMGSKLRENGVTPLALDGNIYGYNAFYYCYALERVMGPGNLLRAAKDKSGATFDEPGYLNAARLVSEISSRGKNFFQKGYENGNYPQAQAYWARGKAGSILCGDWIPTETSMLVNKAFKYRFYPFPEVSGGVGKSNDIEALLIGGLIPKGAKNPEGAKKLLKFMVSKQNAESFAKNTFSISSRTDVDYPEVLKDVKTLVEGSGNFIRPEDGLLADTPEWFANVFFPLDNKLIYGQISPETFIREIKSKSIEYYKDSN